MSKKNVIFAQTQQKYNHGSKHNHERRYYGKQNGRIIGISAMLTLWFGDINIHVEVELFVKFGSK